MGKLQMKSFNVPPAAVASKEKKLTKREIFTTPTSVSHEAQIPKTAKNEIIKTNDELSKMAFSEGDPETSLASEETESVSFASETGKSEGKFRISTRVAPVFLNNFRKGSAVDNALSQKAAAGEVTFSYGVNIAYEVSEKVNIRSGINKVDLAYNVRKVSFNDMAASRAFDKKLQATTTLASPSNGTLNQKMGFLKIPLEVEYMNKLSY